MATKSRTTGSRARTKKPKPAPKKKSTRSRSPGRARKAPARTPVRHTFAAALAGRGADLTGLFLIVVGVLAALGIYGGTPGPLSRSFDEGFGWIIGVFRYLAPPVIFVSGLVVIRRGDDPHDLSPRFIVGGLAAVFATAGLVHMAGDSPPWGSSTDAFSQAGGVLGLAVGGPLQAMAGVWGALLVLIAVNIGGLVVMTGVSLKSMLDGFANGARPIAGAAAKGTRSLFVMRSDREVIDLRDSTPSDGSSAPSMHVGGQEVDFVDAKGEPVDATIEIPVEREPVPASPDGPDDVDEKRERTFAEKKAIFDQESPQAQPEPTVFVPSVAVAPQQLETELTVTTQDDHTWVLPSMSLLTRSGSQSVDQQAVLNRGRVLERALAEHGVETTLVNMVVGPTVTRFELELGLGVKVSRIKSLNDDIAYAMASPDVRIIAPIPGKQAIGVEVPNETRQTVAVGDILSSVEAADARGPMEVAIGRDINGVSLMVDLSKMPHTLVAGATGAGKSSGINSIITSLLMRNTPNDVRMILIDPKRVEMTQYERIPHLLTQPVTDPKKAANALAWAVREMERRYELLEECRFRDITGYNEAFDNGKIKPKKGQLGPDGEPRQFKRLPYILVVVDELSDLMMVAARDVEESIVRIGQKARAVGIHMVIATQRPSVDVITGLIKANVPARIAYAVSSMQDSRVILGSPGAERLVGKGDMLFQDPTSSTPIRLQGAWVEESEVKRVVDHWRQQVSDADAPTDGPVFEDNTPVVDLAGAPTNGGAVQAPRSSGSDFITADRPADDDTDDLLWQAMELIVSSGLGSTSMLQRKLRVGFARAGRIMDELEQNGVVGPSEGSKAREVLLSPEELQQLRGDD